MSSESALSKFLENFSPISLRYTKPEHGNPWVFWSETEGCENNSSSADPMIHDKIKSALSDIDYFLGSFGQFWAPVTIGGRRLLSTSGQPFAVRYFFNYYAKYRLHSEKYKFNIDDDANKLNVEPEHMHMTAYARYLKHNVEPKHMHMIISGGGPTTAFLNCRTSLEYDDDDDDDDRLDYYVMVPICFPSQSSCIGVLEITFNKADSSHFGLAYSLLKTVNAVQKTGLDVFYVQDLIPYKTINALQVTKDEIEKALKVVCGSHNLALAQVWIPYEDKINVPISFSLEKSKTKRLSGIKLTGYLNAVREDTYDDFEPYFRFGDVTPRAIGEELPLVTLQDYESHYTSKLRSKMLVDWESATSAFAICLKSNNTGDLNYAFEFIWTKHSNYVIFLEAILLTLKRCLPGFKFASGAELGDALDVHSKGDETKTFKIFQRNKSMVLDYIAHSEVTCKTTPKVLPREVIEKQFGKTMKDAAKNLNVSLSTLKRKFKELGIPEWPGPNFVKRRNPNTSSIIQINTNEEDNGAIEDTSTVNININMLTVKAEYEDDMIKFHLPISQATFVNVKKEIGMELKLSDKSYKLKYLDEDGDWISLTSDEKMNDCIRSSKKSDRIVVRMRVLPSLQLISGHGGSLGTFFI